MAQAFQTPQKLTGGDPDLQNYFDRLNREITTLRALAMAQAEEIAALRERVTALETP